MKTILFTALIALVTLSACHKDKLDNGGTFTIKGRWLYDCSGKPHANEKIYIRENVLVNLGGGFNRYDDYDGGSGFTDANGNFSISCENYGTCVVGFTGNSSNSRGIPIASIPGGNGNVYDLGNLYLYDDYTTSAVLKIVFATRHTDTFYIGYKPYTYGVVYPAIGTRYLLLNGNSTGPYAVGKRYSNNRFFYQSTVPYSYGFGWSRYVAVYDTSVPRDFHNIFSVCSASDTTTLNIP